LLISRQLIGVSSALSCLPSGWTQSGCCFRGQSLVTWCAISLTGNLVQSDRVYQSCFLPSCAMIRHFMFGKSVIVVL